MDYKEELMMAYCALEDIITLESSRMNAEEEKAFETVNNVIGRAMLRHTNLAVLRKNSEGFLSEQRIEDFKLYFAKAKEAMKQREIQ